MPSSSVRRGEWYTYSFSACLSSDRSTRLSVGRPILSRVCLGTTLVTRRGDGGGDSTVDDLGTAAVLIFAAFFFAFFSLFSSFPLFCGAAAFFLAGVLLRARFSFFLAGILLRAARAFFFAAGVLFFSGVFERRRVARVDTMLYKSQVDFFNLN